MEASLSAADIPAVSSPVLDINEVVPVVTKTALVRTLIHVAAFASIGFLMSVLTLVVFPVLSNGDVRTFSIQQRVAISQKREALSNFQQSSITPPPTATSQPYAPVPAYSYRTTEESRAQRADAVTIVFTGAASVWDVAFDMTSSFYGNQQAPVEFYGSDPGVDSGWRNDCSQSAQFVSVGGSWVPSSEDVQSRDYSEVPLTCESITNDNWVFHVRLYEIASNATVGTPHYDSEDHGWGSYRFDETRDLVAVTFVEGSDIGSNPRWFVKEIWQYDPAGDNTDPRGCLLKDEFGNPVHNPGSEHIEDPEYRDLECFNKPDGDVYFIDLAA